MTFTAEFNITLKQRDRNDRHLTRATGFVIPENTPAERDRAFAAVRKLNPDAWKIELTGVAKTARPT